MPGRYGADNRVDPNFALEYQYAVPMRTIGPIRATTPPISTVIGAPFSVGASTGCANAAFMVTGGAHISAVLGVGLCPPNTTAGNAWINNQLVVGTDPGGSALLRLGGARPVVVDVASGFTRIKGDAGGWSVSYGFYGSAGTDRGGFGALGGADALTYFYIGDAYNSATNVRLTGAAFTPGSAGGLTLGTAILPWDSLRVGTATTRGFFYVGSEVNIGAETAHNVTIVRSAAGIATFTGAAFNPASAGGLTLGTAVLPWSAAFTDRIRLYSGATQRFGLNPASVGELRFTEGTDTDVMIFDTAALKPATAGGRTLGTASLPWGAGFFKANEAIRLLDDAAFIAFYNGANSARSGFIQFQSAAASTLGTDVNQPLDVNTNGALRWRFAAAGHLITPTDNTYDIGATGATRPRNVYTAEGVGVRNLNVTAVGTGAATTETDLMTHTLPTLADGDTIEVVATGQVTGNNNTKTVRLKVGTTTFATTTYSAASAGNWFFNATIWKDGTANQFISFRAADSGGTTVERDLGGNAQEISGSVVKVTGETPSAADEVNQQSFLIRVNKK